MYQRTKNWLYAKLEGPRAWIWLSAISFAESSFFPVPPDVFLIPVILKQGHRWLFYSVLVAGTSVIGGLFGYLIGFAFFETIGQWLVDTYNLHSHVELVKTLFDQNAFWYIFIAAFTPIPYKVFTIAAGLFSVNIFAFTIASLLGRGIRYLVLGFLVERLGRRAGPKAFKYFDYLMLFLIALIIIYLFIVFI